MIIKYLNADHALFNRDTDYQKLLFDVSFIQPLVWRRQVIALHANTEVVFADDEDIPFFELSSLGGDDTMRGYFPQRFLGKGSALINLEYRLKLIDFNFASSGTCRSMGSASATSAACTKDSDDFLHHPSITSATATAVVSDRALLGPGGAHRRRLQPRGDGSHLSDLRTHLLRRRRAHGGRRVAIGALGLLLAWRSAADLLACGGDDGDRDEKECRSCHLGVASGCFNECRGLCVQDDPNCEPRCAAQCDEMPARSRLRRVRRQLHELAAALRAEQQTVECEDGTFGGSFPEPPADAFFGRFRAPRAARDVHARARQLPEPVRRSPAPPDRDRPL
jgi:hypothetical protein